VGILAAALVLRPPASTLPQEVEEELEAEAAVQPIAQLA
jgi:hypothetical protein